MDNSLYKACEEAQIETVRELLKQGANPNTHNEEENKLAPLHISKNTEITQLLISYGADLNITDRNGNTPLHLASLYRTFNLEKMTQLLNQGANLNALNNSKYTALHFLLYVYNKNTNIDLVLDAIRLLMKYHAEIDILNKKGESPLYLALRTVPANKHKLEIIHELLKLGANPNSKKISNGNTLLHLAAKNLNIEIMRTLLENGAEPNALDNDKNSPLHRVFKKEIVKENRQIEAIEELVKHGANINAQDDKGKSMLHHAIGLSCYNITKDLLKLGADPKIRDKNGITALEMALASGYKMNLVKALFLS